MTRTLILLGSHVVLFLCGFAMAMLALRGRRQALVAQERALSTREIFLDDIVSGRVAREEPPAPLAVNLTPGRHRRSNRQPPRVGQHAHHLAHNRTSLLPNATLAEVEAHLVMARARRETEHRAFVSIMNESQRLLAHLTGRTRREPQFGAPRHAAWARP